MNEVLMDLFRQLRHSLAKTKLRAPLVWIRHKSLRSGDVFIASYPRSGNTWLTFMLTEVLTGQSADFVFVARAIPYIGKYRNPPQLLPGGGRLFKTHELYRKECRKAIYLVRDARDVVISEFHYQVRAGTCNQTFEAFLTNFAKERVSQFGSWSDHVSSWLAAGDAKQVDLLVIKFENLRQRTESVAREILDFLGVKVNTEVIQNTIRNNSIEKMREKEDRVRQSGHNMGRRDIRAVGHGSVEGWHRALTGDQAQLIQRYAGKTLARLGYIEEISFRRLGHY